MTNNCQEFDIENRYDEDQPPPLYEDVVNCKSLYVTGVEVMTEEGDIMNPNDALALNLKVGLKTPDECLTLKLSVKIQSKCSIQELRDYDVEQDGLMIIRKVVPGEVAYQQGFRPKDVIVQFGPHSRESFNGLEQICGYLKQIKGQTFDCVVVRQLENGTTVVKRITACPSVLEHGVCMGMAVKEYGFGKEISVCSNSNACIYSHQRRNKSKGKSI